MADNPARSFRPRDLAQDNEQRGADPLAELARLIGHTDPFADFGRGAGPAADARPAPADWRASEPPPDPSMVPAHGQSYVFPSAQHAPLRAAAPVEAYDQGAWPDQADAPGYRGDADYYGQPVGYAESNAQLNHPMHEQPGLAVRAPVHHDDEDSLYDDPPRKRPRGGGLRMAMALVLLAVVGTAAAFGYRAVFSDSSPSGAPPVIKADAAPTKVTPGAETAALTDKPIQDRLAVPGQGERVVSREEKPILLNDGTGTTPQPNTGTPFGPQIALGTNPPAPGIVPGGGVIGEPKRIRTVLIRPDGPEVPVQPQPAEPTATTPAPRIVTTVPRATPDPAPAPRVGNAPLSLNPSVQNAPPPTRTAAAPTNLGPAPAPAAAGGYVVQVSSQRSEDEARAAFATLQNRFPSQLGAWQPAIRRADLGSRGVFYRTVVGPFGSQGEAADMCQSLKSAGGDCVILKN